MLSEFKIISMFFVIDIYQNATLSDSFEGKRSRVIGNRCKDSAYTNSEVFLLGL